MLRVINIKRHGNDTEHQRWRKDMRWVFFLYLISFLYSGVLTDNEDIIIFKHDSTRMIVYICFILIALMSYVFEADYMCRKQICCAICMNSSHGENIPQLQRCKTVSSYALYFKYMYKNEVSDNHKT